MAQQYSNNSTNMVTSLASLLKQVRFFGYGPSDLDSTLDPDIDISLDQPLYEQAQPTSQDTMYQPISYNSSDYSSSGSLPEFDNTPILSESSYSQYSSYISDDGEEKQNRLEDYNSDKEDEDEDELDSQTSRRRRRSTVVTREEIPSLTELSMNEVAQHDMLHDCWMILYDKVYDVTQFLYEHPGGEDLIMEHAGRDGTLAFRGVGHSKAALQSLQHHLVGVLPEHERMFTDWEDQQ